MKRLCYSNVVPKRVLSFQLQPTLDMLLSSWCMKDGCSNLRFGRDVGYCKDCISKEINTNIIRCKNQSGKKLTAKYFDNVKVTSLCFNSGCHGAAIRSIGVCKICLGDLTLKSKVQRHSHQFKRKRKKNKYYSSSRFGDKETCKLLLIILCIYLLPKNINVFIIFILINAKRR